MKTQVLFQVLLSVCLLIATTCYGQTGYKLEDLKVEKTGYDLQGTLRISQSYDKQTKMLTLKMKNEYKHDIILYQSITPHLFVCDYANQKKNSTNTIPISITGDALVKKKIVKPYSIYSYIYELKHHSFRSTKKGDSIQIETLFLKDKKTSNCNNFFFFINKII